MSGTTPAAPVAVPAPVPVPVPIAAPVPVPVVVIGGGQAGLATGFHLRRAGLTAGRDFVILDGAGEPGGSWSHVWRSLRLFSPASYSSLPGWPMPPWPDGFPPASHVRAYLRDYEARYELDVRRPARVRAVERVDDDPASPLLVRTDEAAYAARVVVSATGTWERPFWPAYPGMRSFRGTQLHSASYQEPGPFAGRRVVVVGGGNTAAQLLAEVSTVAETTWVTVRPPRFMADDVDGRDLFAAATRRARALAAGQPDAGGVASLGDIVMVPPVKDARARGVLHAEPMFDRLLPDGIAWADGRTRAVDAVLWCTGFRPALDHLRPLHLREPATGRIATGGAGNTRSVREPRLHLVGYGDWTGLASATLIGVGRTARDAAAEIVAALGRAERTAGAMT